MKYSARSANRNRGFVMVAVLVCLTVIGMLMFVAIKASLQQRHQLDRELQMEQTRLLAEAGIGEGIRRFRTLPDSEDSLEFDVEVDLRSPLTSQIDIEVRKQNETQIFVQATAVIGLDGRPETRTKQKLSRIVTQPTNPTKESS